MSYSTRLRPGFSDNPTNGWLRLGWMAAAAFLLLGILAGCTEYERRGVSPLPQNRPSSWEMQPFGQIHM